MQSTNETVSFVLTAYDNIGELKYLYFCVMLPWYVSICVVNLFFVVVICVDKTLHEPMYILLCNLLVNEIHGSTALYPLMLSQMISDSHDVTLPWCFLQMCCIYTSVSVEFCNLAAMAYDRYIAICYPLHYNVIMSTEKVFMVIALVWIYSFLTFICCFSFILSLKFCGNLIEKVLCGPYLLIKLTCSASVHSYASAVLFSFMTIVIPFGFISVSYMKILSVCLKTSKENRHKAISTCMPQFISVSNLFFGSLFHSVDSGVEVSEVPNKVRIILSIYLLMLEPMVTPFMYGFKLPKIRQACKRLMFDKVFRKKNSAQ